MATTAINQKELWASLEALPEIELPDGWYFVPAGVQLPARWRAIAEAEPGKPGDKPLAERFSNGGKPFKHTVVLNMPGPQGTSVTVVSPAENRFVTIGGEELEALRAGKLDAARSSAIHRVVVGPAAAPLAGR